MAARIRELRRNAWREGYLIAVLFLIVLSVFIYLDAFEMLMRIAIAHESWQLDEILTALVLLPFGLIVFSVRRLRETQTELRRRLIAERRASVLARYDPLTGLPTRRSAGAMIRSDTRTATERPFAVVVLDLKRFSSVNRLHGNRAGDRVMLVLSERLKDWAGADNYVSRLVGDEFLVLLRDVVAEAELMARITAIAKDIQAPICVDPDKKAGTVIVGASIGVTVVSDPSLSSDQILSQAYSAMQRAKETGDTSFAFFERGMDTSAQYRAQLEVDLRDAITNGEIVPYFQPVVNLADGRVVGFEALARWHLPDGSLRQPDLFINVAEQTGQIENLYYAMIEQAAREAATWPSYLFLAVNISPLQFNSPWLVENTLRILAKTELAAGRLEVEITESALAGAFARARKIIAELRRQRIRISLDDFGTGYSSLQHLTELKFDKIKIDRSFVQGLESNESQRAIIRAIVTMAHAMKLEVTVEGIDSPAYAQMVRAYGCDQGQGYLFGKPQPFAIDENGKPALAGLPPILGENARISRDLMGEKRALP